MPEYKDREDELCLQCDCGAHYLTLTYFEDEKGKPLECHLTLHLQSNLPLWWRIKWAWRVLWDRYNGWESFYLNAYDNTKKLQAMINKMVATQEEIKQGENIKEV